MFAGTQPLRPTRKWTENRRRGARMEAICPHSAWSRSSSIIDFREMRSNAPTPSTDKRVVFSSRQVFATRDSRIRTLHAFSTRTGRVWLLLNLFRHLLCIGSGNQPFQEVSHHDATNPTCGLLESCGDPLARKWNRAPTAASLSNTRSKCFAVNPEGPGAAPLMGTLMFAHESVSVQLEWDLG